MEIEITRLATLIRSVDTADVLRSFVVFFAPIAVIIGIAEFFLHLPVEFEIFRFWQLSNWENQPAQVALYLLFKTLTLIVVVFSPVLFYIQHRIATGRSGVWWAFVTAAILGILFMGLCVLMTSGIPLLLSGLLFHFVESEFTAMTIIICAQLVIFGFLIWLMQSSINGFDPNTLFQTALLLGLLIALLSPVANFIIIDNPQYPEDSLTIATLLQLLGLIGAVLLLARAFQLRLALANSHSRSLIYGDLEGVGPGRTTAHLLGIPTSMWTLSSLRTPALWSLLFSRPVVYAGIIIALNVYDFFTEFYIALLVGAFLVILGHVLFKFGKYLAAGSSWNPADISIEDNAILFLRSFGDDSYQFKRRPWSFASRWMDLWSFRSNLDGMMIDEAARYGKVIAIGNPDDTRRVFGASRHFLNHQKWRSAVTETAAKAKAIVIIAGDTEAVKWELDLIQRRGWLQKTMVLFPEKQSGSEQNLVSQTLSILTQKPIEESDSQKHQSQAVALLTGSAGSQLIRTRKHHSAATLGALRLFFQRNDHRDMFGVWYAT